MHIANILKEKELYKDSVVKEFLTTAADGKNYNVVFYSLEMIIAVGYRVRGLRGTQFRQRLRLQNFQNSVIPKATSSRLRCQRKVVAWQKLPAINLRAN